MGVDKAEKYIQKGVKAWNRDNYYKARDCFERARDLGSIDAVNKLGHLYYKQDGFRHPGKAKTYFKEIIDKGYVDSYPKALLYYAEIEEFHENYETARVYYEKAVEEYAITRAMRNLAKMLLEGRGGPCDVDRAEKLMRRGIEEDDYCHEYRESEFYKRLKEIRDEEEKVQGMLRLKKLEEEKRESERISALGAEAYLSGDYDTAFKLLYQTRWIPDSCFYLALMYREGIGVEKDEERAFELLEYAVRYHDHEPSKKYLTQWRNERFELAQKEALKTGGDVFEKAEALWTSFEEPETYMPYYEEAARAGIFEAQIRCAEYYYVYSGPDKKKALYWYEAVAAHDSPDNINKILNAHYMCGFIYEEENDEEKAYQWYLKGADKGDRKSAAKCVRIVKKRGNYANYFEELKNFAFKGFPGAMLEFGIKCYNGYVALSSTDSSFPPQNDKRYSKYFGENAPDASKYTYGSWAKQFLTDAMTQTEDEKVAAKAKEVRKEIGDKV